MSGGRDGDDGSLGALVMQITGAAMRLVQGEIALRKAEAREIALIVIRAVIFIVIGLVLALLGLGQLTEAAHAGLVQAGLSPVRASIATGGILCLIAGGLIWWQLRRLRRVRFLARMQVFAEAARKEAADERLS